MIALYYKITGPEIKVSKTDKEMPIRGEKEIEANFLSKLLNWGASFVPCEEVHPEQIDLFREICREAYLRNDGRQYQEFLEALSQGIIIDAKTFEELVEVKNFNNYLHSRDNMIPPHKAFLVLKESNSGQKPKIKDYKMAFDKLLEAVSTHKLGRCSHFGVETGAGISAVRCAVCEQFLQVLG